MDSEKPWTRHFPGGIRESHRSGDSMTSGWIILARSNPDSDTTQTPAGRTHADILFSSAIFSASAAITANRFR